MLNTMKTFNPYMPEPERDVSTCSDELDMSDFDKSESEECSEDNVRVGDLDLCKCGNCLVGKRKIYCLCCFEVHTLTVNLTPKTSAVLSNQRSSKRYVQMKLC